jgi:hypothetical protein
MNRKYLDYISNMFQTFIHENDIKKNKGPSFCMVVYTMYAAPCFIHQMDYFTSYLPFSGLELVSSDSEEVSNSRPGIQN